MTSGTPQPSPRGSWRLLLDSAFGPFFVGNLLSNSGTWFQNIAAILLIYDLTGSATLVGLVSAMQFGFTLLLSPLTGVWADRVDRRALMLVGQTLGIVSAISLAVLVGHGLTAGWVLILVAVAGVGHAVTSPAMQASIPALVRGPEVATAVALQSLTFNLARAIGPALGALVYVSYGPAISFSVNAVTYLVLVVVLLFIRFAPRERRKEADRSVLGGLRFVRSSPALIALLIGVGALGFAMDPVNTLSPSMAELFGRGDTFVGFMVATFGAGAVCAVPLVGPLRRGSEAGVVGRGALLVLGAAMAVFAIAWSSAAVLIALFVGGAAFLVGVGDLTAAIHERIDDELRGRVMAIWGMSFLGLRPIAAVVHGRLGDLVGPRVGVAFATVVAVTSALVVGVLLRRDSPR